MINLKNKSIVVTGGTRGIGVEITKTFLRHDAVVFILARQKPKKLIQAKGNKAIFVECDIRDIKLSIDTSIILKVDLFNYRFIPWSFCHHNLFCLFNLFARSIDHNNI